MNRLKKITEQLQPQNASGKAEEFLGVHTCVPALIRLPYVHKFLHGNYKLPPYVICTGNGERVRDCLKYLDDAVLFQDVMRSFKLNPYRIEIAVGLYKGTPIIVFEHQIGSGSTEIYLKELLSNQCMTNIYKVSSSHASSNNKCFTSDSKYLIRLGTSLGINSSAKQAMHLNVGDISVSTHQVGISSTDFQAMSSNLNIFNAHASMAHAAKLLGKMGYTMKTIKDDKNASETWPVVAFDQEVHETLTQRVTSNYKLVKSKYKCVSSLGNVSKDSLYSEEAPETFVRLRRHCDVGTSDMEAATIIRTTKQMGIDHSNKIKVGFCSIILGVLGPNGGDSFVSFDKSLCNQVQWISALEALHQISQKHIN